MYMQCVHIVEFGLYLLCFESHILRAVVCVQVCGESG